jgi:hypothetical protein
MNVQKSAKKIFCKQFGLLTQRASKIACDMILASLIGLEYHGVVANIGIQALLVDVFCIGIYDKVFVAVIFKE